MSPEPTGRVESTPTGRDLVLTRRFRAPIREVWAALTESDRTATWFGPWRGEGGEGKTIEVKMAFEEGDAWLQVTITACEPPTRLEVTSVDDWGSWDLEALLSEMGDGVTELRFLHHLDEATDVSGVGPGWEYYLDNLVAAFEGRPLPSFADYYPAQKAYYEGRR